MVSTMSTASSTRSRPILASDPPMIDTVAPDAGARPTPRIEFSVKSPTIPIPFHRMLKVVAVVDREDAQVRQLLDHIAAEKFEVEVSDRYDRDVSEDADVGAYIVSIDGDRREPGRDLGRAVRAIGFGTPLWALADSHQMADVA